MPKESSLKKVEPQGTDTFRSSSSETESRSRLRAVETSFWSGFMAFDLFAENVHFRLFTTAQAKIGCLDGQPVFRYVIDVQSPANLN